MKLRLACVALSNKGFRVLNNLQYRRGSQKPVARTIWDHTPRCSGTEVGSVIRSPTRQVNTKDGLKVGHRHSPERDDKRNITKKPQEKASRNTCLAKNSIEVKDHGQRLTEVSSSDLSSRKGVRSPEQDASTSKVSVHASPGLTESCVGYSISSSSVFS